MAERDREMEKVRSRQREISVQPTDSAIPQETDSWTLEEEPSNPAPSSMMHPLIVMDGPKAERMLGCCRDIGGRSWLTLVSGLVECLCFAGVVFGWASLVFVLKTEGYFRDHCVNATGANSSVYTDCSGQDEQFALIFTIASFLNSFLAFPLGFVFDQYGTMAARILGIALYTTGTLLVAVSSATLSVLLFPGISFIDVGGILFLMTNIQVGNLFGPYRSTIITLYNGPYDSSSSIFLIIKVLHERGISLRSSFLFISACSVIHLLRTFLLLPKTHIPYPLPEGYTYGMSCGSQSESLLLEGVVRAESSESVQSAGGTETAFGEGGGMLQPQQTPAKELSFGSCVLSWFFLFHLVWLSVMQLRLFLFIDILNPMIDRLTSEDPALVSRYTNAFGFTQLCGVFCAPWNGLLLDRQKRKWWAKGKTEKEAGLLASALSLFLTALLGLLFSICASIPVLPLQYLTFALQVISTSFLFGGNAAFISIAFPFRHYGKLYGLMSSLSAVVLLLQFPLLILVNDVLQGDPLYVNLGLTLLMLVPFLHPLYIQLHCQKMAARQEGPQGLKLHSLFQRPGYAHF